MDSLKIPLLPERRFSFSYHNYDLGPRSKSITSALPVYLSRYAKMAHRVRSGALHFDGKRTNGVQMAHVSVSMWCGQSGSIGNKGQLMAVPPEGVPLCGTCEGRAVGAGYPSIAFLIQKHALLFSPREGAESR